MGDNGRDLAMPEIAEAIKPFTNRRKSLNENVRRGITSPYKMPSTTKLIPFVDYNTAKDRQTRFENLHFPLHAKSNRRMRKAGEQASCEQQPASPVHTVVDIYPEFYSVIEGRPLRCSGNIKVYLNDIRNYATLKQQIGYRRDMIMQLDMVLKGEEARYEKIYLEYKEHVDNFQEFIKDDHISVMNKIHEADLVRTALNANDLEYIPLVSEMEVLKGRIVELEEIRQTAMIYRKFIYSISPLSWRNIHDENYRRTKNVFDFKLEQHDEVKEINLDSVIKEVKMELKNDKNTSHMYFTHPHQLLAYFENLVLQCKKYLIHVLSLASPAEKVCAIQRSYKESLKTEEEALSYYVEHAETAVNQMLNSAKFMQNVFWVLMNKCYFPSLATPDVLKLHLCIEYAFIEVFGQGKFIKSHPTIPTKMIEQFYNETNLKLDLMNIKIVKESQEQCFREDLKAMRAAYDAAKTLRGFEILKKALRTAYLPPAKFQRPVLTKFKKKALKTKKEPTLQATNLTKIQRENLELFTTWCTTDDPKPYLQNLKNSHFNLAN